MVDAVERPRDQTTGMAKGFAFITFKDPAVVETIVGQRWLTLPNGARIECKDWLFTFMVPTRPRLKFPEARENPIYGSKTLELWKETTSIPRKIKESKSIC